jgi:hypothetical protein
MRTAMKLLVGLALAVSLVMPAAPSAGADQSVLKSFGLSRNFEDYLAKPGAQVPWLDPEHPDQAAERRIAGRPGCGWS